MDLTVSVIIPNYNHQQYLPMAIENILSQTYAAFEIIIIDDCSTDNSLETIEHFAAMNSLIRVIKNKENKGVIYNLNLGLQEACGQYILFAAADDWVEPELLQTAVSSFIKNPRAAFFSAAAWQMDEDNIDSRRPILMPCPSNMDTFFDSATCQELLYKIDSWFIGNSTIYNRELLAREGGFDENLGSFTDNFMCRVLAAKYGCCFSPSRLATWRVFKQGYAMRSNVDVHRQQLLYVYLKEILNTKYKGLFVCKLKKRMLKRFKFNLFRTFASSSPNVIRKIYTAILFVLIRPFDAVKRVSLAIPKN